MNKTVLLIGIFVAAATAAQRGAPNLNLPSGDARNIPLLNEIGNEQK